MEIMPTRIINEVSALTDIIGIAQDLYNEKTLPQPYQEMLRRVISVLIPIKYKISNPEMTFDTKYVREQIIELLPLLSQTRNRYTGK